MLHAQSLTVPLEPGQRPVTFEAGYPEEFANVLEKLL